MDSDKAMVEFGHDIVPSGAEAPIYGAVLLRAEARCYSEVL
jgi:hypothetical protein